MTKKFGTLLISVACSCVCAQEMSPPENSPAPILPSQSTSPITVPAPTATPAPSASSAPRTVRLSFLPPPMEGTITLGIFDGNKKLVRVLHREAKIDNFVVGENSLGTTWDGKSDTGEDLPPGKYHARGYMVDRELSAIDTGRASEPPPPDSVPDHVSVKLKINPLVSDTRSVVDLAVGFDNHGTFLKTMDDLPLRTINQSGQVARAWLAKRSETMLDVWQDDGKAVERFQIANIQAMMAFDCGDFILK